MNPTLLTGYSGKGGGGTVRTPKEDPDSLQSRAYARIVDLLSEGPIEGFVTEEGIVCKDASLRYQPKCVGGQLLYRPEDGFVVGAYDGVVTGKLGFDGQETPIFEGDSAGYPFLSPNSDLRVFCYVKGTGEETKEARFILVAYPRTVAEQTAYESVYPDVTLPIYPEGRLYGIKTYYDLVLNELCSGEGYTVEDLDAKVPELITETVAEGTEPYPFQVIVPAATGQAIFLDGAPLNNPMDLTPGFKDITVQYRYGYETQEPMPGFDFVEQILEISNNANIIERNTPWIYETTTNGNWDRLLLNIELTNGFFYQNTTTGDVRAISETEPIKCFIQHWCSRDQVTWTNAGAFGQGTYRFFGKTTSRYERTIEAHLNRTITTEPVLYWRFKVTRLSPDDADLKRASNDNLVYNTGFRVSSITAITDRKLIYPFCALVGIQINAEQFTAIPVRSYRVKLLRLQVPTNYFPPGSVRIITNPTTGIFTQVIREFPEYCRSSKTGEGVYDSTSGNPIDQVWDGTFWESWTDNPAWIAYNVCMNERYGFGKVIKNANKWWTYRIGRYCDQRDFFNGPESQETRRFTCSTYFQQREEAFKVLTDLASVFSGYYYFAAGGMVPVQDAPKITRMSFAPANVEGGFFNYRGTQRKVRHTVGLVYFNDPSDQYRLNPIYYEEPDGILRYGPQELEKTAFGCTDRGQARRLAKRLLRNEISNTDVVSFVTGIQASVLCPGNVFSVYDPTRSTLPFGGRVIAIEKTDPISESSLPAVILDREVSTYDLQRSYGTDNPDTVVVNPLDFSIIFARPVPELDWNAVASSEDLDRMMQAQLTPPMQVFAFEHDPFGRLRVVLREQLPSEVKVGTIWGMQGPIVPQYFTVLGVEETEKHKFSVTGIEYHSQVFDYIFFDAEYSEDRIVPDYDAWRRPSPPRNLQLIVNGLRAPYHLNVSWTRPERGFVKNYEVHLRRSLGNYQFITSTQRTNVDFDINQPDSYSVRVYAIGLTGMRSEPAEVALMLFPEEPENMEIVSGLEIRGQGNDHKFYSADLDLDWRINTSLADSTLHTGIISGTVAPPVKDYSVIISGVVGYPFNNEQLLQRFVPETEFKLTEALNRGLRNGPYREMIVEIRARTEPDNRLSAPTRIRVLNERPLKLVFGPGDVVIVPNNTGTFTVQFPALTGDSVGYRVWASLTPGFTPLPSNAVNSNLLWSGEYTTSSPPISILGILDSATCYVRVAEFDALAFDELDCNISDEESILLEVTVQRATLSAFDFLWKPGR